jgi:hypothetical protein
MRKRSLQDLLAERRANVLEMSRERDAIARAMLQAHINEIDREIGAPCGPDMICIEDPREEDGISHERYCERRPQAR